MRASFDREGSAFGVKAGSVLGFCAGATVLSINGLFCCSALTEGSLFLAVSQLGRTRLDLRKKNTQQSAGLWLFEFKKGPSMKSE